MIPKFLYSSQLDHSGKNLVAFPVYEANLKTGEIIAYNNLKVVEVQRKTQHILLCVIESYLENKIHSILANSVSILCGLSIAMKKSIIWVDVV